MKVGEYQLGRKRKSEEVGVRTGIREGYRAG